MPECLKLSGGHSGKTEKAIIRGTDPSRDPGRIWVGWMPEDLGKGRIWRKEFDRGFGLG